LSAAGDAEDPLAELRRGRDPQILDVLLDLTPRSRGISRQQFINLMEPCLDPGSVNFYRRRRAAKLLDLAGPAR